MAAEKHQQDQADSVPDNQFDGEPIPASLKAGLLGQVVIETLKGLRRYDAPARDEPIDNS